MMENIGLQIGNYIQITKEKEADIIEFPEAGYANIFKITSLKEGENDEIEIRNDIENIYDYAFYEQIEPIEITGDLMWKLNFKCLGEKRDWFDFIKKDDKFAIAINIQTGKFSLYSGGEWRTVNCPAKIKYVHEVQNLMKVFGYTVSL